MFSIVLAAIVCAVAETPAKPLSPVPFTDVKLTDGFWARLVNLDREKTLPHNLKMCEETGRITNFDKAAGKLEGRFEGIFFNDSDIYKTIEGAANVLALRRDSELEKTVDGVIDRIAAAQQPDGYLYTFYTVNKQLDRRFAAERDMHETYCAGHLIEAAVAYYQATGKRKLLGVAIRVADLLDSTFGVGKKRDVPGHEEVELALIKLWQVTKEPRYLRLARFFVDERGHANGRELNGEYSQDHIPVKDQREIVGHAVRAMYLYCAVADLASVTGDPAYRETVDAIWRDVTGRKMYVTGGIGPSGANEGFTVPYDLPNQSAYCETCASVGMVVWNQRMALLHHDAKYADVVERVLYNGFLSGLSRDGKRFFYVNPLASFGQHHRESWFGCACCPPNVVRLLPTIGGYVYARDGTDVFVNQYVASRMKLARAGNRKSEVGNRAGAAAPQLVLTQKTNYPWDGDVKLTVEPTAPRAFALHLRIPGWCQGPQSGDDLYRFEGRPAGGAAKLSVNGKPAKIVIRNGYAVLRRRWKKGDTVELSLAMPALRVKANPKVRADRGRVALQRGPIVYCLEATDNGGQVASLAIPPDAKLSAAREKNVLGGVTVVQGGALARTGEEKAPRKVRFTAVPYYAWDNREPGQMAVWIPEDPSLAQPRPNPTIASESKPTASFYGHGTISALNDQVLPSRSGDQEAPHFTWWPHLGTTEWVQYTLKEPTAVSGVEVYWFDDTWVGACRIPKSWRVLYLDGGEWKPVEEPTEYERKMNAFNRVSFKKVTTAGLRVEVQCRPNWSGGILEWRVIP
jgi:DUF1680 family protein